VDALPSTAATPSDTETEDRVSPTGTASEETGKYEFRVETEAPCVRRITITVEPGHVGTTRRREAKKLARSVRIKGFRKGKVPSHVIEERYGPLIDERTVTALVNEGFRAAVLEHGLRTVGEPAVDDVRYDPGESLTYSVDVEVMPEVKLERTTGFRLKRPEVTVSDADVDEILEEMRSEHAVLEPVERAPTDGDVVSVRIRPVDEEGGDEAERKPYRFELGAGYAIPDVEAAILGLEPGGSGVFDVAYPADFGNEELAGTTRSLEIDLVEVKAKRLPELDDDFAREMGDFESLAELREAVGKDLRHHREHEADGAVREQLIDALLDANAFEVPPGLVSRYLDRVLEAPEDAPPERVAQAREQVRPAVERQIKRDLMLDRLIEQHGAEPSKEDMDRRLQEIAERNSLSVSEVRQRLAKEKRLDDIRREMAVSRVFETLLEGSEVS